MKVQKHLNKYLKKNPMGTTELAQKIGISQPTVSRIINENISVSDKIVKKMLESKVITKEEAVQIVLN